MNRPLLTSPASPAESATQLAVLGSGRRRATGGTLRVPPAIANSSAPPQVIIARPCISLGAPSSPAAAPVRDPGFMRWAQSDPIDQGNIALADHAHTNAELVQEAGSVKKLV